MSIYIDRGGFFYYHKINNLALEIIMKKIILMSLLTLISFSAFAQTYLMREHIIGVSPSSSNSDSSGSASSSGAESASSHPTLSSSSSSVQSSSSSSSSVALNRDYSMTIDGFSAGHKRLNIDVNYVESEQTIYFAAVATVPAQVTLTFSNGEVHQFYGPTGKNFSMSLQTPRQQQLSATGKIGPSVILFSTSEGVVGATTIFF